MVYFQITEHPHTETRASVANVFSAYVVFLHTHDEESFFFFFLLECIFFNRELVVC